MEDPTIRTEQSRAILTCTTCGEKRYVEQEFLDELVELTEPGKTIAIPRHIPCKAEMALHLLEDVPPSSRTTQRLALALQQEKAPAKMIGRALIGYYDDYRTPHAGNIAQLIYDANQAGLKKIAERAMNGEFDATKEEYDAWAKSSKGKALSRRLYPK